MVVREDIGIASSEAEAMRVNGGSQALGQGEVSRSRIETKT
jgi:hypothetical protein